MQSLLVTAGIKPRIAAVVTIWALIFVPKSEIIFALLGAYAIWHLPRTGQNEKLNIRHQILLLLFFATIVAGINGLLLRGSSPSEVLHQTGKVIRVAIVIFALPPLINNFKTNTNQDTIVHDAISIALVTHAVAILAQIVFPGIMQITGPLFDYSKIEDPTDFVTYRGHGFSASADIASVLCAFGFLNEAAFRQQRSKLRQTLFLIASVFSGRTGFILIAVTSILPGKYYRQRLTVAVALLIALVSFAMNPDLLDSIGENKYAIIRIVDIENILYDTKSLYRPDSWRDNDLAETLFGSGGIPYVGLRMGNAGDSQYSQMFLSVGIVGLALTLALHLPIRGITGNKSGAITLFVLMAIAAIKGPYMMSHPVGTLYFLILLSVSTHRRKELTTNPTIIRELNDRSESILF